MQIIEELLTINDYYVRKVDSEKTATLPQILQIFIVTV